MSTTKKTSDGGRSSSPLAIVLQGVRVGNEGCGRRVGQRLLRFRIFLASPADVEEERKLVQSVIEQIRVERTFRDRVNLQCIAWDQPGVAVPLVAALTPQEAISRGMPKPSECDLVVVIFWSRIGTPLPSNHVKPDGSRYLSGTEWEYQDAVTAFEEWGKPLVWLYRRNPPPSLTASDPAFDEKQKQQESLETFLNSLKNEDGTIAGGMNSYATPDEFRRLFEQHLRDRLSKELEDFKDTRPISSFSGKIQAFFGEYLVSETGPIPFGGRDADLARLDRWLEDGQAPNRLLLAAPAARGKSALLICWMASLHERGLTDGNGAGWRLAFLPISMRVETNRPSVFGS